MGFKKKIAFMVYSVLHRNGLRKIHIDKTGEEGELK